jgi:hypothetical protein
MKLWDNGFSRQLGWHRRCEFRRGFWRNGLAGRGLRWLGLAARRSAQHGTEKRNEETGAKHGNETSTGQPCDRNQRASGDSSCQSPAAKDAEVSGETTESEREEGGSKSGTLPRGLDGRGRASALAVGQGSPRDKSRSLTSHFLRRYVDFVPTPLWHCRFHR